MMLARQNFRRIMRYMQQRGSAGGRDRFQQIKDFLPVGLIKAMARFIQNKQRRTFYSGPQDQNGTLLTVA